MWVVFPCLEIEDFLPISGVFKKLKYHGDIKTSSLMETSGPDLKPT
jgi:hypothetical protein